MIHMQAEAKGQKEATAKNILSLKVKYVDIAVK